MRISVRTKQIAGVTAIVFSVVALMGGYAVTSIARVLMQETQTRAEATAGSIYQQIARLAMAGGDVTDAIRTDPGLRSALEASAFWPNMLYAAVVDQDDIVLAHIDSTQVGARLPTVASLQILVEASPWQQARAIYQPGGLTSEARLPLMLDTGAGEQAFGSIRVGVSTLLLRDALEEALRPALLTSVALLIGAVLVATLLAQWLLRPIMLLSAGMARLGQGETGVTLDFAQRDEFADLGESFNVVSARLAREHAAGRLSRDAMSKKMAALGAVSSNIAHEVKNPLNAMRIHLELLRQQAGGRDGLREHVKVLSDQMRRLDEVVDGFLNFTRAQPLSMEVMSPQNLFDELLPIVEAEAGKTGVHVEVEVASDVTSISVDRTQMHHALLNLAINACHAMPTGGRLRLSARQADASSVQLMVEDTGTGIAPEDLQRIFNLYFTTKPEGSGVGLSLVYRTVILHNGDIAVQSVVGEGTTFTITLPAAAW